MKSLPHSLAILAFTGLASAAALADTLEVSSLTNV
jgi:hypothetical protein